MPQAPDVIAELDDLGEAEVRRRLILGVYGKGGERLNSVLNWLGTKEAERKDASQAEQAAMARQASEAAARAATAAERQAEAAERANHKATIALIIAAVSMIVAVMGLFVS